MSVLKKNPVLYVFIILGLFTIGILSARLTEISFDENARFQSFTDSLFEEEVQGNTLNLHYTLADPKEYGIHNYPLTLGTLSEESISESAHYSKELLQKLKSYEYTDLSSDNQILYDTLSFVLETESHSGDFRLFYEPLSPTLGIQAQLPILLAEYTFRNEQDIKDYLILLEDIKPYFEDILTYEQQKSSAGLFMNTDTADGIIAQFTDFISDKENHFLVTVFNDKIHKCTFLSDRKKEKYINQNLTRLQEFCFPAYELLIEGLSDLRGTGLNEYGLCYYENGQEYYQHLVESSTGIYDSVEDIEQRLYKQLYQDYMQIQRLFTAYPDIAENAQLCLFVWDILLRTVSSGISTNSSTPKSPINLR